MANTSSEKRAGMFSSAGWLFADMFLALMMVFIVASTVGKYTPPPKKGVVPTPTPHIIGMRPDSTDIEIAVDVDTLLFTDPQAARKEVEGQIRTKMTAYQAEKAAVVLTFGCGPDDGRDTETASSVNDVLRSLGSRHFIFDRAVFKNYIDRSCNEGTVKSQIYFYLLQK